jgi:hypothetical protein
LSFIVRWLQYRNPDKMLKVYCEHGALTTDLRAMQREGLVDLVHFPYDPDSLNRKTKTLAVPSEAQWRDLNIPFAASPFAFSDHQGSQYLLEIREVLGSANRRDALHVDSAFKSGCRAFITRDRGLLAHRQRLEDVLGIRFFHPDKDREELLKFIHAAK